MDLLMPKMDGVTAIKAIKLAGRNPDYCVDKF